MSQELVKLAKDNGSSDNISIVVVFLKPIEELAAMELPVTKDINSDEITNGTMNNNDKEMLYDGITSTSIYVGKNAVDVTDDDNDSANGESRKTSSSSGAESIDELKPNNPFASPDGGGFVYSEVVNPFSGMTGKDGDDQSIPPVDQSLEGMINEAFGTVSVNKLDDFKNASPSMFDESMSPSLFDKAKVSSSGGPGDFMASTEGSWINNGSAALNANPFIKGDSGFISPACQSNNHSASSEDSAENHDEREAASSMASNEEEEVKSPVQEEIDEEEEEAKEVTKLLSGGIMETQFGDLIFSANRGETPTPPMEDTGMCSFISQQMLKERIWLISLALTTTAVTQIRCRTLTNRTKDFSNVTRGLKPTHSCFNSALHYYQYYDTHCTYARLFVCGSFCLGGGVERPLMVAAVLRQRQPRQI